MQAKVLPFWGCPQLATFFTKLLRPLVKYWRCHGHKVVVHLDEGMADKAKAFSSFVQNSLCKAGFVAHPVKSSWELSYQVSWGFQIDLEKERSLSHVGKLRSYYITGIL